MAPDLASATLRRRRRQAAVAALLAAAACLMVSTPLPLGAQGRDHQREEQQLERPEVTKLVLRGVHHVDPDELRQSIATDASHCKSVVYRVLLVCTITKSSFFYQRAYLDRAEFARDVLRIKVFYFKRGYRDAQVDTSVSRAGRNQVAVAFDITEGPPTVIESLSVVQRRPVLQRRQASRQLRVRAGDPLDLLRLDSTVVRIRQALWNRGYADAVIDTAIQVDPEAHLARVTIAIDPKWQARVGSIEVVRDRGSRHEVSDRTILNSLTLRPGDLFVYDEVLRSQRSLYESNLFSRAAIVTPRRGDSVKTLDVTVREAPLNYVRASAGFNTVDYVQTDAQYTRYNFLGGGRRFSVQGGVGNIFAPTLTESPFFRDVRKDAGTFDQALFLQPTWLTSADFVQPWLNGPRNSLGLGIFAHRRATPGVVIDRGFGAQASFTRELAVRAPASLAYRYELTRVEAGDVYFCVNFGVCDPLNIGALRSRQALSPVSLSAQMDRSNDALSPTAGARARFDAEHASAVTASDYRYNRIYAEGSAYRSVGAHRAVIAGRVRLGWVGALSSTRQALGLSGPESEVARLSIIHPRKRFYAGGSQSVRGFGENQLGPRVLTVPPDQLQKIGCDISTPAGIAACDPDALGPNGRPVLGDAEFTPRPLGGNTLVEANLEYRFPVWKAIGGAVFVDGALVGQGTLGDVARGTGAITPGFGFRYYSPVGPIRVDLGFNPFLSQNLTVVTEDTTTKRIVELGHTRTYAPARTEGSWYKRAANRLQLHFSIGQAF